MNCGKCHDCGEPIRFVLDGEEWCDKCHKYQRPVSHGWASKEKTACLSVGVKKAVIPHY